MDLTPTQALDLRMASLLLRGPGDPGGPDSPPTGRRDVAWVVTWLGAMQAQDAGSAMWSLGVRLPDLTADDVQAALERREALRTWPMRGTVHLVPPRDARWMLAVLGSRTLAGAAARRARLGLSDETADRAVDVLGQALAGGGRLTRAQCLEVLSGAGIPITGQLGYHLLWYASQQGVTCIGPHLGKEQTFVLLDEWAPDPYRPDPEEALGIIALRYFRGHGPTTRQDFAGWTGLTATQAKKAIALAGDRITAADLGGATVYLDPLLLEGVSLLADDDAVYALPGFDEYMLGYKDRSLMLEPGHRDAVVPGGNGMFRSTLVRGGRVIGTWTRATKGKRGVVSALPLVPLTAADRAMAEAALEPWAAYVGVPLDVLWLG